MKYAIIDIGSNSVRLAIFADGKVIYRDKITARLGEGIAADNTLKDFAVRRALNAVIAFYKTAKDYGVEAENILPFATAAVRQTKNGSDFVAAVYDATGISVDVLSEDGECEVALIGALGGKDGAVLDVGGASSELVVSQNGKIVYAKSLPIGAVKLRDAFLGKEDEIFSALSKAARDYSVKSLKSITAIGGTACCLSFVLSGDKEYDRDKNHGRFVPITDLYANLLKIKDLSGEEISRVYGLEKSRAETIFYGGALIYEVLKYFKLDGYTLSENDNLEGYYLLKTRGKGYEKK